MITWIRKVDDSGGNEIQIAAVVMWRVHSAAAAVIEIGDDSDFLRIQFESGVRKATSQHACGNPDQPRDLQAGVKDGAGDPSDDRIDGRLPAQPVRQIGKTDKT